MYSLGIVTEYIIQGSVSAWEETRTAKGIITEYIVQGGGSAWEETCIA
jgi:hypothetical protein